MDSELRSLHRKALQGDPEAALAFATGFDRIRTKEGIFLPEDLAEDLRDSILTLMSRYDYNPNGADSLECSFCGVSDMILNTQRLPPIHHSESCVGERYLREVFERVFGSRGLI